VADKKQQKLRTTNKRDGHPADYRGDTPEQVAEAVLPFRAQPGNRSKQFVNPSP